MEMDALDSLKNIGHHLVKLAWCRCLHVFKKFHMEKVDLAKKIASEVELRWGSISLPEERSIHLCTHC